MENHMLYNPLIKSREEHTMTIQEFQDKLEALRVKSGMREDISWPFVYDADEVGEIYVNEEGKFFFSDKISNWVESHLTLDGISNLRYMVNTNAGKADRDIFVNFVSGDSIKLHNWKKNTTIYTSVTVLKTEENADIADTLKGRCECYDNLRGNTIYVTIKKLGS